MADNTNIERLDIQDNMSPKLRDLTKLLGESLSALKSLQTITKFTGSEVGLTSLKNHIDAVNASTKATIEQFRNLQTAASNVSVVGSSLSARRGGLGEPNYYKGKALGYDASGKPVSWNAAEKQIDAYRAQRSIIDANFEAKKSEIRSRIDALRLEKPFSIDPKGQRRQAVEDARAARLAATSEREIAWGRRTGLGGMEQNAIASIAKNQAEQQALYAKSFAGRMKNFFGGAKGSAGDTKQGGDQQGLGFLGITMAYGGARVLKGLVSTGAEFEKQMSNVRAVTGGTESDLKQLEKAALEMGRTTVFSASQAAGAMFELGKAGFSTREIMQSSKPIMQLSVAGQMDFADASELASNTLRGFNLNASDMKRVAEDIAVAAVKSTASVNDIGSAMSYVSGTAGKLGISVEDTSAALAVLSNSGLKGSRAGRSLDQMLSGLIDLTPQATKALAKMGLTATDIDPRIHGLRGAMDNLTKAGFGIEQAFEMFSQNSARAIIRLTGTGIASFDDMRANFGKNTDELGRLAEEMTDNLLGSWAKLRNSLDEMIISGSTSITHSLNALVKLLHSLVQTPVLGKLAIGIGVLGTAILSLGAIVKAFKYVWGAFVVEFTGPALAGVLAIGGAFAAWAIAGAALALIIAEIFKFTKAGKSSISPYIEAIEQAKTATDKLSTSVGTLTALQLANNRVTLRSYKLDVEKSIQVLEDTKIQTVGDLGELLADNTPHMYNSQMPANEALRKSTTNEIRDLSWKISALKKIKEEYSKQEKEVAIEIQSRRAATAKADAETAPTRWNKRMGKNIQRFGSFEGTKWRSQKDPNVWNESEKKPENVQNEMDRIREKSEQIASIWTGIGKSVEDALTGPIEGMLQGLDKGRDAWKQFGKDIVSIMRSAVAKMVARDIMGTLFPGMGGSGTLGLGGILETRNSGNKTASQGGQDVISYMYGGTPGSPYGFTDSNGTIRNYGSQSPYNLTRPSRGRPTGGTRGWDLRGFPSGGSPLQMGPSIPRGGLKNQPESGLLAMAYQGDMGGGVLDSPSGLGSYRESTITGLNAKYYPQEQFSGITSKYYNPSGVGSLASMYNKYGRAYQSVQAGKGLRGRMSLDGDPFGVGGKSAVSPTWMDRTKYNLSSWKSAADKQSILGEGGSLSVGNVATTAVGAMGVAGAYQSADPMGGALSGAAAGTAILPGLGTAIGAAVGAISGFAGGAKASRNRTIQRRAVQQDLYTTIKAASDAISQITDPKGRAEAKEALAVAMHNANAIRSRSSPKNRALWTQRAMAGVDRIYSIIAGEQMTKNLRAQVGGGLATTGMAAAMGGIFSGGVDTSEVESLVGGATGTTGAYASAATADMGRNVVAQGGNNVSMTNSFNVNSMLDLREVGKILGEQIASASPTGSIGSL
jgi:TP901 family phage tail tape measure protein